MTEQQKVEARVARGVRLLDVYTPDWTSCIELRELRMESYSDCILGQVFGGFGAGAEPLGLKDDVDQQIRHGFDMRRTHKTEMEFDRELARLGVAWRAAVKRSRQKKSR